MIYSAPYESPFGPISLESNGLALVSLSFGIAERRGPESLFIPAFRWLDAYFSGKDAALPPLSPGGTDFQQRVWRGCCCIPRGCTCTYGALAAAVGAPRAGRAVGSALARNPLLLLIPCHRVLPVAGGAGMYAAGAELKLRLLQWEMIDK
ncbi:MAG: methylated-DNA--[Akkermansia sp.]|nr:methylated-DNA--[protein]-cysteine S-methyltransferase [Akkermansia sp.]